MNRNKTSVIWTLSKEKFIEIVESSKSTTEALKRIANLCNKGANYKTLKQRLIVEGYSKNYLADKGKKFIQEKMKELPLGKKYKDEEVFVVNSSFSTTNLKKRIFKSNLLDYKCIECNLGPSWNSKPLTLQLDHINGISDDNRLENLRFLCPNCHSQTDTFAGKRFKVNSKKLEGRGPGGRSPNQIRTAKEQEHIQWPSDEELAKLVWEQPRSKLALQLGVSDVAIAKRCKKRNISQPPRGYWAKVLSSPVSS